MNSAYKMVEKHIAGTTMTAALAKAKEANSQDFLVSMSFLSEPPTDRMKSRYITNTYMQLARQLSRLGIKGSIHVPMGQLGIGINEDAAVENVKRIMDTCSTYGMFSWYEVGAEEELSTVRKADLNSTCGIAFENMGLARKYMKARKSGNIKLVFLGFYGEEKEMEDKEIDEIIDIALDSSDRLTLSSVPDGPLYKFMKKGKTRKSTTIEIQYGYDKKLSDAHKSGYDVSVFMPFGKDWIRYALNKMPKGKLHTLASNLLGQNAAFDII